MKTLLAAAAIVLLATTAHAGSNTKRVSRPLVHHARYGCQHQPDSMSARIAATMTGR